MSDRPRQLPLALPHQPDYSAESFLPGASNRVALALVKAWPDWPAPVVVLSGPPGSGKTHLAHIWAERAGAEIADAPQTDALALNLPGIAALVVEDIGPEAVPEEALFHLINNAKENGGSLLLTSREPADSWCTRLADLRSRLRSAAPAALAAPDEALLRQVLVKLFADRQLVIDKPLIDYLLARMERSLSAAAALVDRLDREALASGRPVTRPLAGQVLADFAEGDAFFADRQ